MNDGPIFRHRFNTLEELIVGVRHWDLEFKQLTADRNGSELSQFRLGPVLLTHVATGCRHVQQGASPPGAYTFALLADDDQTAYWCGHLLGNNLLAVFAPRQDFEASVYPRFSVYTVTINSTWLDEELTWQSISETMKRCGSPQRCVLRCDGSALARLRALVMGTLRLASSDLFFGADKGTLSDLGADIIEALLAALGTAALARESVTAAARTRMLRKVLDYIGDRPGVPIRMNALCRSAQVSERTLQRAFLERFDVTPKVYLQALRLNGIRRDLLSCAPSIKRISNVATRWGFWHMGQFARDYKRLFAELPSQTLSQLPQAIKPRTDSGFRST